MEKSREPSMSITRVPGWPAVVLGGCFVIAVTSVRAAPVVVRDTDFDLADYDVVELETGDLSPLPQPDGFGRITVTRETGKSSGAPGDYFARVEMEGYDTTGSTGYGQLNALLLWKQPIDSRSACSARPRDRRRAPAASGPAASTGGS
jgi:hypothetical protein